MKEKMDAIESFARTAHEGQTRRFSGEPYIVHPLAVKRLLEAAGVVDEVVLSAALLHDVVEDTKYTLEDVRNLAGDKVAGIVDELTLSGDKQEWLSSFADKSPEAIMIKLCDRICNIIDFLDAAKDFKVEVTKPLEYYRDSQPVATAFLKNESAIKKKFGGSYQLICEFYVDMMRLVEEYRDTLLKIERLLETGIREFKDKIDNQDEYKYEMNEIPNWINGDTDVHNK